MVALQIRKLQVLMLVHSNIPMWELTARTKNEVDITVKTTLNNVDVSNRTRKSHNIASTHYRIEWRVLIILIRTVIVQIDLNNSILWRLLEWELVGVKIYTTRCNNNAICNSQYKYLEYFSMRISFEYRSSITSSAIVPINRCNTIQFSAK
jgi:hypothetical protein